jgi:hypothetical protein
MQTNWTTYSKVTEGQMVKVAVNERGAFVWTSRSQAERWDAPFLRVTSIERPDPRTIVLTFEDGRTGRWTPNSKGLVAE